MGEDGGESRFDSLRVLLEHGRSINLGVREFKVVTGYSHLESQHREKD